MYYGGYYGMYWDPTYILVIIGMVICLLASARVKSTYAKFNRVRSHSGITAAEAAERIRKEVQTMLEDLSTFRYDKEAYHKRMRERTNMQNKVYDEETP